MDHSIYHRKGLVELGFVADEKMESVEIEGGTTEFEAAGNGDRPGVGLAHGLKPSPLPVCCCCIGFVDDVFPLPLLKEGEERMFPKISEKMNKKIRKEKISTNIFILFKNNNNDCHDKTIINPIPTG